MVRKLIEWAVSNPLVACLLAWNWLRREPADQESAAVTRPMDRSHA